MWCPLAGDLRDWLIGRGARASHTTCCETRIAELSTTQKPDIGQSLRFPVACNTTRNVEAFFKKTDIAYHPNPSKKSRFGWYTISVFFKNASTLRVEYEYNDSAFYEHQSIIRTHAHFIVHRDQNTENFSLGCCSPSRKLRYIFLSFICLN